MLNYTNKKPSLIFKVFLFTVYQPQQLEQSGIIVKVLRFAVSCFVTLQIFICNCFFCVSCQLAKGATIRIVYAIYVEDLISFHIETNIHSAAIC